MGRDMRFIKKILLFIAFISAALGTVSGLPEAVRTRAPLTADRPDLAHFCDSDGGHFRIWYSLQAEDPTNAIDPTDNDGNGIPDWAENAGRFLERTWACLVDTLGARQPIPDMGIGGNDRVDMYFLDLSGTMFGPGTYGMTYLDSILPDGSATAFIAIENDFEPEHFPNYVGREEDALAVTCAHEFFHTVQFAYGFNLSVWLWWMEATAVWSEERNYPEINDYLYYLANFQGYPSTGLDDDDPSGRIYGACLFPLYISQNYGDSAIIDIWENVSESAVYSGIKSWADSLELTLDNLYGDFARWNLYVGDNSREWCYPDAALMPEPEIILPSAMPEELTGGGGALYIDLTGLFGLPEGHHGGGWAEMQQIDTVYAALEGVAPSANSDTEDTLVYISPGPDTIPGIWRFDNMIAILANMDMIYIHDADLGALTYGPAPSAKVEMEKSIALPPYPNPFVNAPGRMIYFPYSIDLDTPIRLTVWASSGDLVFDESSETSKGLHLTTRGALGWEPSNMSGENLADGVYIYRLAIEGDSHIGKISIINE